MDSNSQKQIPFAPVVHLVLVFVLKASLRECVCVVDSSIIGCGGCCILFPGVELIKTWQCNYQAISDIYYTGHTIADILQHTILYLTISDILHRAYHRYNKKYRKAEYVQCRVCFVNVQSSQQENVVFSVCAHMCNAAYVIFIMWNSISGLDACYHFRLNISCGVAVMVRSHQKKGEGEGLFLRDGPILKGWANF